MKIKTMSFGIVLLAVIVLLFSVALSRAPQNSYAYRMACEINPVQCAIPSNMPLFPMLPR
jgi:hypothetical protein